MSIPVSMARPWALVVGIDDSIPLPIEEYPRPLLRVNCLHTRYTGLLKPAATSRSCAVVDRGCAAVWDDSFLVSSFPLQAPHRSLFGLNRCLTKCGQAGMYVISN